MKGLYFRKSVKVGPFRLNFSKSGMGWSTGVRGLRVGRSAKGRRYVAGGTHGIYFRQYAKAPSHHPQAPVRASIEITTQAQNQPAQATTPAQRDGPLAGASISDLSQTTSERHEQATRNLSPLALRLHTVPVAAGALALTGLLTLIAFASSSSDGGKASTGSTVAYLLAYGATGVIAVVDWQNFTTLHGTLNWPRWRSQWRAKWYWLAICGFACFASVAACVYLIQCIGLAGQVHEVEHEKIQTSIADLERQLGLAAASTSPVSPPAPTEPPPSA